MFQNGHPTIGVLLNDANASYQIELTQTLSDYGKKLGYNIAIFTSFSTYGNFNNNALGEYNILNLPPYERFDAIIVCSDTYDDDKAEQIQSYLDSRCRGPVVCIRRQIGNYPSVLVENTDSIRQMVYHFHNVHHFSRIAFFSGPSDHPDSIDRF